MPKFRKKSVVVEAEQFKPYHTPRQWPSDVVLNPAGRHGDCNEPACFVIPTLEGDMTVTPGDWIITDVKGERYPCTPDIFEQTYEPIEEGA